MENDPVEDAKQHNNIEAILLFAAGHVTRIWPIKGQFPSDIYYLYV